MAEPAGAENWIVLVGSAIGSALLVISVALKQYFTGGKEEIASTGEISTRAVGAAFVDRTAAEAVLRIDANVAELVRMNKDRLDRAHEEELAERIAERLRREQSGKT